jgi:hypothetical protein
VETGKALKPGYSIVKSFYEIGKGSGNAAEIKKILP